MELAVLLYIAIGFLGLVLGSFAGATVWRIRARQLVQDDTEYKKLQKKQRSDTQLSVGEQQELEWLNDTRGERLAGLKRLRPLTQSTITTDRSRCLHCQHELAWYDLLPLVSWLSTGGRCRYCHKSIGLFEPLMEVGTAVLLLLTYQFVLEANLTWLAVIWLVVMVLLVILFAYDFKWFLLPDKVMFPLIALSAVYAAYQISISDNLAMSALSIFASIMILGGLYLLLWAMSSGRLVGFGDVKLGLALGLLILDWQLAIIALFLANLIGTLVVLPGLLTRKLSRKTQVPFGPFLIIGFLIALFWGQAIISGYDLASIWLANVLLML